jgi:hypothetical protein
MTVTGAAAALASLVLHFSEQGNDSFGCDSETLMMSGTFNTNKHCTREMAACNFLPKYIKASERSSASVACNEAVGSARPTDPEDRLTSEQVVVKWLQLILVINALIVLALFSVQARLRRTTRHARPTDPLPKGL